MSSTEAPPRLDQVRQICFNFAGTEEKLSHGMPFFHVGGRGFASYTRDHHGEPGAALWCKSTPDEQRRLVGLDPEVYFVPPYVGVKGWVGVRLERPTTDFEALAIVVEEAWLSVAPKRLHTVAPSAPPEPPTYPTTDPAVVAEALKRLTSTCASLPGATIEAESWRTSARVNGKPFAHLLDNVHRDGRVAVSFRVSPDVFDALVEKHPERYFRPPYSPGGWVAMRVDTAKVAWKALAEHVETSYRAAAPAAPRAPKAPRAARR